MKSLIIVPLMLVALVAGPFTLMAQNNKEKKINREMRKIEKHTKKLQELKGVDFFAVKAHESDGLNQAEIKRMVAEAQKQAWVAQKDAHESMIVQRKMMQNQKQEMEKQMIIMRQGKKMPGHYSTGPGVTVYGGPGSIKIESPDFKSTGYTFFPGSLDNLSINKDLTDESSTADFNYEVKEGTNSITLTVNGAMETGKVTITIKRPDGVVFNEYTLSPLANVNWKQTLKFEDQEEKEYLGKWTVTVSAESAKGNYAVQISGR